MQQRVPTRERLQKRREDRFAFVSRAFSSDGCGDIRNLVWKRVVGKVYANAENYRASRWCFDTFSEYAAYLSFASEQIVGSLDIGIDV